MEVEEFSVPAFDDEFSLAVFAGKCVQPLSSFSPLRIKNLKIWWELGVAELLFYCKSSQFCGDYLLWSKFI